MKYALTITVNHADGTEEEVEGIAQDLGSIGLTAIETIKVKAKSQEHSSLMIVAVPVEDESWRKDVL